MGTDILITLAAVVGGVIAGNFVFFRFLLARGEVRKGVAEMIKKFQQDGVI